MKIQHKLYLTSALLVSFILVMSPAIYLTTSHLRAERASHDLVDSVQKGLSDLRFVTHEYVWYQEERMYQQWYAKYADVIRSIQRLATGMPAADPILESVKTHLRQLGDLFSELVVNSQRARRLAFNPPPLSSARVRRQMMLILLKSREISDEIDDLGERTHSRVFQAQRAAVKWLGSLSAIFLVLGILAAGFWLFFVRTLARRIGALIRGIQMLGRGNLDYRLNVVPADELGEVALAFNQMTANLKETTVSLSVLRREVEERRRAEITVMEKSKLVDLLQAVAVAANEAGSAEAVLRKSIELIGAYLGWPVGHIYLAQEDGRELRPTEIWYLPEPEPFLEFRRITGQTCFAPGLGLPGKVAATRQAQSIPEFCGVSSLRKEIARQCGLKSAFAFPVFSGSEVLAVMEFFHVQTGEPSPQTQEAMINLGIQLGRGLERTRANETKTLLATIVQSSGDALIGLTHDGKITSWNPAAELLYGYAASDVIGKPLSLVVGNGETDFLEHCRQGKTVERQRAKGYRKDDAVIDLSLSVAPILGPRGELTGFSACVRDITDLVRVERETRESEARFRLLFAGNPQPMWVIDPISRAFLEVNQAALRHFGYSREEFLATSLDAIVLPEDRPRLETAFRLQSQANSDMPRAAGESDGPRASTPREWRLSLKKGDAVYVQLAQELIQVAGRSAWIVVANDTTERRRAEEGLREQGSRLRLVLDQIPGLVWSMGKDLRVTFTTGMGLGRFGSPSQDLIGSSLYEYFSGEGSHYPLLDAHMRALRGESVAVEYEWASRTFACHIEPFVNDQEEVVGVIGVGIDISDRKHAEESLKRLAADLVRSNQELEEFAYVVSHDLQEPLRMVTCYLNLLRQRYRGRLEGDAEDFIGFAVDGAGRMKELIGDLLAYSRVGSRGKQSELVNAAMLMPQVLSNLKVCVEESGAKIECGDLPMVQGDSVQLSQLFQNLISNAIKFRKPGTVPVIQVSVEPRDADWVFYVRDNGIGIPPENSDRVFNIFQRLHSREEYPGTGVGLAICKKIVQRHGGRIWVESDLGQGARFCFTLPRATASLAPTTERLSGSA